MSEKEDKDIRGNPLDNHGVSQTEDGKFYIDYQGTKVPTSERIREMLIKQLMIQGKSRKRAEEELKNILDTP